jgi:hypothetical protein
VCNVELSGSPNREKSESLFLSWALLNELASEEKMSTMASSDKNDTARINERRDLSEGSSLIRVDPGGQYATLVVDHPDKRIERACSIVSSPYEEGPELLPN